MPLVYRKAAGGEDVDWDEIEMIEDFVPPTGNLTGIIALPEINRAPENPWLEDEISSYFQGLLLLVSGSVNYPVFGVNQTNQQANQLRPKWVIYKFYTQNW